MYDVQCLHYCRGYGFSRNLIKIASKSSKISTAKQLREIFKNTPRLEQFLLHLAKTIWIKGDFDFQFLLRVSQGEQVIFPN